MRNIVIAFVMVLVPLAAYARDIDKLVGALDDRSVDEILAIHADDLTDAERGRLREIYVDGEREMLERLTAAMLFNRQDIRKETNDLYLDALRNAQSDRTRFLAARLASQARIVQAYELIRELRDKAQDHEARVEYESALWNMSQDVDELVQTGKIAEDPKAAKALRYRAALLLTQAGIGNDATRKLLEEIQGESSFRGQLARASLSLLRMREEYHAKLATGKVAPDLKNLQEVLKCVQDYYVEDRSTLELIEAACDGVLRSLDQHSRYMPKKEFEGLETRITQEYSGIGAYVDERDRVVTIVAPIRGGPAWHAGLMPGDQILKVDDWDAFGKGITEVVDKLKGVPGTSVRIQVYHKGWVKARWFTIVRETITIPSVNHAMLPEKIGLIILDQFGMKSRKEMLDALTDLENKGMKGLILDLRGNGGGVLEGAVNIARLFLDGGPDRSGRIVVTSKNPRASKYIPPKSMYSWGNDVRPNFPMVVLINEGSASASEILAGALKDHGRATLLGEKTFGKGSVQEIIRLENNDRIKLTIAKFYLPNGECIDGRGIVPDFEVTPPALDDWKIAEMLRIKIAEKIEEYREKRIEGADKELLIRLAKGDGGKTDEYPFFDEFYGGLKTTLSKDDVRKFLRALMRRQVLYKYKLDFFYDLQEDIQIQTAVYELMKKMDMDPEASEAYRAAVAEVKKYREEQKQKTAMLEQENAAAE